MSSAAPDDEQRYRELGEQLRREILAALPSWIESSVRERTGGIELEPDEIAALSDEVGTVVDHRLSALIAADVDEARSGPLEIIRQATDPITEFLRSLATAEPSRDPFEAKARPEDVFALGPMTFADLGDDVQRSGIAWGAAKAYLHRRRRAQETGSESD